MNIVQMLGTNCTSYYANRPHVWLAFHFTAGKTSKKGAARNTATWFANPQNRNGSADFIVDDAEMVQYNADLNNRRCWAVGDDSRRFSKGGQLYGIAVNCNTISIEICSNTKSGNIPNANSPDWYFTEASLQNALELGAYLMKKYNIDIDHVVRHYDISGKYCPGIIGWNTNSGSDAAWRNFKTRLKAMTAESEEKEMAEPIYKDIKDVPEWYRPAIQKLLDAELINGGTPKEVNATDVNLTETQARLCHLFVNYVDMVKSRVKGAL